VANRYFSQKKSESKIVFELLRTKRKSLLEKLNELDFSEKACISDVVSKFREEGLDRLAANFEKFHKKNVKSPIFWNNPEINERGCWTSRAKQEFDETLCGKLVNFFKEEGPVTVCDLGCGCEGYYTLAMLKAGVNCKGFDGNPLTAEITNNICKVRDLTEDYNDVYDWALCLEVGEHIPKEYEKVFIENLHRSNKMGIILSWAVEGQGGKGHVNERNNEYIKKIFSDLGYLNDVVTEKRFRKDCDHPWFKNTTMVFRNLKNNLI